MINPASTPSAPGLTARRLRFGAFEVDLDARELRHRGIRVHLQKKPFQILELLLRRPGALVTRTELADHLWPGLHVSFGRGSNTAVNTLRQALGDSSGACHYIETRSGLGYRFLAAVEEVAAAPPVPLSAQSRYTPKPDAHQDYRKGKYLQQKMTEADLGKSIVQLESAIAQDPPYALARTALADTYILCALLGMLPSCEACRRAKELNAVALALDPDLAEAHASRAAIRMLFDWNYPAAESGFLHALQLQPASVDTHRWYAMFLSAMSRPADALQHIRLARDSDPLSLAIHVEAARHHYMERDFDQCMHQSWQALVLEAGFSPAQHLLGLAYEQGGMYDEAVTELENARICSGDNPDILAALGHIYARGRNPEAAAGILHTLDALSRRRFVSPFWRSIVYAGLGAHDLAFASLDEAYDNRDVWLVWLKVEPRFDPLRSQARFDRLLEKLGLGE